MYRLQCMLHYLSHKYVDLIALFRTKRQYLYKHGYSFMILYTRIEFFLSLVIKSTPKSRNERTNALMMLPAMRYWHFRVPTGRRNRYENIYYILFHKPLKSVIRTVLYSARTAQ